MTPDLCCKLVQPRSLPIAGPQVRLMCCQVMQRMYVGSPKKKENAASKTYTSTRHQNPTVNDNYTDQCYKSLLLQSDGRWYYR